MQGKFSLRKIENLHIPLWLLKDICWVMEWKTSGIIMIFPTVSVAFYIAYLSRKTEDFFINLAICFWISANAFWMCCEFFGQEKYKVGAAILFICGLICSTFFYFSQWKRNKKTYG